MIPDPKTFAALVERYKTSPDKFDYYARAIALADYVTEHAPEIAEALIERGDHRKGGE